MYTIQSAHSPSYTQDGGIDLNVKFKELDMEIPFHAMPDDVMPYGAELFKRASLGEYGEVAPYVPETTPIVPNSVTKRQACLALLDMDLYDSVVDLIQAAGKAAQIEWETTSAIERGNALLAHVQTTLGWSDYFVDELFTRAGEK